MATTAKNKFDFLDLTSNKFDMREIANSLSMLCRFNGHVPTFYSVAQHSVLVSNLCPKRHKLTGLLHDAMETYIGDIVSPLKQQVEICGFTAEEYEQLLWEKFSEQYNVPKKIPEVVKLADIEATLQEAVFLGMDISEWELGKPNSKFPMDKAWSWYEAKIEFLTTLKKVATL